MTASFTRNEQLIEQFRAAIHKAGLRAPAVIEPDGKLHRFASNGKRSDDAGWYVFHDDGIPAGAFGDWRDGLSETWRADIGRRLSPQEEAAHRARVEAMRREREVEEAKRKVEAREKAAAIGRPPRPPRRIILIWSRKASRPTGCACMMGRWLSRCATAWNCTACNSSGRKATSAS